MVNEGRAPPIVPAAARRMYPVISPPLNQDALSRPAGGASAPRSPPAPIPTGSPPPPPSRLPRPTVRSLDGAAAAALRSTLAVPTYAAAIELLARLVTAAGATDVAIAAHPHALAMTVRHSGRRGGDGDGGCSGGGGGHDLLLHADGGPGLADLAEVAEVTLAPARATPGRPATPLRLRPTVAGLTAVPTNAVPDSLVGVGGGGLFGKDSAATMATIAVRRLFARVPVRRRLTVTTPMASVMADARRRLLPLAAAHPRSRLSLTDATGVVWLDVPPAAATAAGASADGVPRGAATAASAAAGGASPDRVAALFGPATARQLVPLCAVEATGGVSVRGAASMVALGGAGGPAAADVQVLLLGGVPAAATGAAVAAAVAAWRRHAPYPPRAVVGGAGRHRTPAFLLDLRLRAGLWAYDAITGAAAAARRRPRPMRPPRPAACADTSANVDAECGARGGDHVESLLAAVAVALDAAFAALFRRCPSPAASPPTDGVDIDASVGGHPRQARLGLRAAKRRRIGVEVLVAGSLGDGHKDPVPTGASGGTAAATSTVPRGGAFAGDLIPRRSLATDRGAHTTSAVATGASATDKAAASAAARCPPSASSWASRLTHRSAAEIRAAQAARSRLWTTPQPFGSGRRVRAAGAGRGGDDNSGLCGSALPLSTDGAWSSGVPLRVSRGQLRRARLLGTAASAVLLLAIDGVIVAVDQHAADERVRFEVLRGVAAAQLRDALYDGGGAAAGEARGATPLPSAALRAPVALHLGAADAATLGGRTAEAAALGWTLERIPPTPPKGGGASRRDGSPAGEWSLTGVPVVAGVPVVGVAAFRSWLASPPPRPAVPPPAASRVGGVGERAETDAGGAAHPTPPFAVVLPPPFIAALAARACHTAVRFGDVLPRAAAAELLHRLAAAANPFVCAHGRPAVVPLAILGGGGLEGGGGGTAGETGPTPAIAGPGIPPWGYR